MTGEAARPATVDDLPVVAAMIDSARPELLEQRGGAMFLVAEAPALTPVEDQLDDPDAVVLVGTYDDVVLGVATMEFVTLEDGRCVGRVGRLLVDAEARKSGIGEAMMIQLLDACAVKGCMGIESMALPGDRHTKNFFESFGIKARMLVVMRAFD